jgi:hypothetical protein
MKRQYIQYNKTMKEKIQKVIKVFFTSYKKAMIKFLRVGNPKVKPKYPEKISESEKIAIETFLVIMKDNDSNLYFDIQTQECFLKSRDSSIYLFLEEINLKIVNTVFGYDIVLSPNSKSYLMHKFKMELAKRRRKFKIEALDKVKHSLEITYNKLIS